MQVISRYLNYVLIGLSTQLYQIMVSVKQSFKYHSKINVRFKILKLFKAEGKGKLMLRHVGYASTFQKWAYRSEDIL